MSQGRRRALLAVLGAAGLALYLWPALKAPVVLWSDSDEDLAWARAGEGYLSPAKRPDTLHPAKPGWLGFLRVASAGSSPDTAPRRIVIIQMLLLWISIAGVCVFLGRRTSFARGAVLYLVLVMFLRLPDSATTVMSETLTAALLLPIVATLLDPPARAWPAFALGAASGLLFLVRPNAGAAAGALAALAFGQTRRWKALVGFGAAAAVVVAPVWVLTSPTDNDKLRGLGTALTWASAEYGWTNAVGFSQPGSSEAARQFVWRLFHGLLGGEYYDASWSSVWAALDEGSRLLSPVLMLGAIACLLAPSRGRVPMARVLGVALAGFLVAQSYLLGALPRFALPFLPALFLCAAAAWPPRLNFAVPIFAVLLSAVWWQRQVLDREWGRIETAGVRINQTIPRGALPKAPPATLYLRVAPPLFPSTAGLSVLSPEGEVLYDSRSENGSDRCRPYVAIPLPIEVLEANRHGSVTFTLVANGSYSETQHLLFPVIPRPWGSPAIREGGGPLSPTTGIRGGSLDWWARKGAP